MADTKKTFPSREEWKAPWEKNGTEFDADTAATLIYNMERNAFTAAQSHKEALESVQSELTTVKGELETSKTKVNELEDAQIKDATERANAQLKRQVEELTGLVQKIVNPEPGQPAGTQQQTGVTESDKELAGLRKGLTSEQAKRLQGSTMAELEADAERYAADLGIAGAGDERQDFVGDDDLFRRPRRDSGYDDGSDNGEMPRGVPSRQGHRTNLGGSAGSRGNPNPAKERELLPRR